MRSGIDYSDFVFLGFVCLFVAGSKRISAACRLCVTDRKLQETSGGSLPKTGKKKSSSLSVFFFVSF